jgi:hypothetical protein
MDVATIKGYTHAPGAPKDWDPARNGTCGALPIIFRKDAHGNDECVSAWKPTPNELAALLRGGFVILSVVGWQVPVSLGVAEKDAAT